MIDSAVQQQLSKACPDDRLSLVVELRVNDDQVTSSLPKRERIIRRRKLTSQAQSQASALFQHAGVSLNGIEGSGHLVLSGSVSALRQVLSPQIEARRDLVVMPNFQVSAAR